MYDELIDELYYLGKINPWAEQPTYTPPPSDLKFIFNYECFKSYEIYTETLNYSKNLSFLNLHNLDEGDIYKNIDKCMYFVSLRAQKVFYETYLEFDEEWKIRSDKNISLNKINFLVCDYHTYDNGDSINTSIAGFRKLKNTDDFMQWLNFEYLKLYNKSIELENKYTNTEILGLVLWRFYGYYILK